MIDRAALLGVGRWGGLSSHIFTGGSIIVGILSSGFFSFTNCAVQNLGLSDKYFRTPLNSWGFLSDHLCPTFLDEALKFLVDLVSFSAQDGLSDILGVLHSFPQGAEIDRPLFW